MNDYLLDTNHASWLMAQQEPIVVRLRQAQAAGDRFGVSVTVLADALSKPVDLLNARTVSTAFQKEIIQSGRVLYCAGDDALAEFEMLTLSYYQKLNEERKPQNSRLEAIY